MEMAIPARRRSIGAFEVGRVLPFAKRRMVGPFVFLDHMGPMSMAAPIPHTADVRPHPHIGLATVTYLFDGEMTHRDSLGVTQAIRPGEVNWMTAGRGISHSERFDGMRADGGNMHGLQAWVALPEADEETAPAFDHYDAEALPRFTESGMSARLIAGSAFGMTSAVKTRSPLFYIDARLDAGTRLGLPSGHRERAIYIVQGRVEVDGQAYDPGQMIVFGSAESPSIRALDAAHVVLLGGEPLGPRHIWWNFVSSRKERIEQAKADWQAGRIALPPHDKDEMIPLPEERKPKPEPMS
ncbi:MAG: pirin family protein [Alphaproteobacteria bacterium]|nr:pirin family protein [Alphaproteobacteria bacterium]